jgi:hypothetical protein
MKDFSNVCFPHETCDGRGGSDVARAGEFRAPQDALEVITRLVKERFFG